MITIELKNIVHKTTARVRVNPTGETEINHGPVYNLRKKLCPNKECTCGKNELGAVGPDNPKVEKRGGSCYIIMAASASTDSRTPKEIRESEKLETRDETDMIHYGDLERHIMIGGCRFLDDILTDSEQTKLFTLIRGLRNEQKYGIKLPD